MEKANSDDISYAVSAFLFDARSRKRISETFHASDDKEGLFRLNPRNSKIEGIESFLDGIFLVIQVRSLNDCLPFP